MTADLAAFILEKTGPVGLRVYLDLEHTQQMRGEAPAVVVLGIADRLRVPVREVRTAIRLLSTWMVIERIPKRTGVERYQLEATR